MFSPEDPGQRLQSDSLQCRWTLWCKKNPLLIWANSRETHHLLRCSSLHSWFPPTLYSTTQDKRQLNTEPTSKTRGAIIREAMQPLLIRFLKITKEDSNCTLPTDLWTQTSRERTSGLGIRNGRMYVGNANCVLVPSSPTKEGHRTRGTESCERLLLWGAER